VRFLTAVLLLAACATAPAAPDPVDLDIRSTVIAEYNVISGPAGRRDWDRFKELFAPGARIGALTPDEYVTKMKPSFDQNGFFQRPVSIRVERHGDTAHVTASDESRHASNDAQPYAQGTTSFELVKSGDAWKIVSIVTQ
jgi:SnoaL-like domain